LSGIWWVETIDDLVSRRQRTPKKRTTPQVLVRLAGYQQYRY